jgi:hypothetical protein
VRNYYFALRERNDDNIRLRSRSYTRHGKTDVDSRTHTTEEELGFQEDLSIGDRNDLYENFEQAKLQVKTTWQKKTNIGGNVS